MAILVVLAMGAVDVGARYLPCTDPREMNQALPLRLRAHLRLIHQQAYALAARAK